jgi:hypothetical protein
VSACLAAELASESGSVALALALAGGSEEDTEEDTTSKAAVRVDTGRAGPEGRAICSNRNSLPTTSLRLLESKSIDNNCRTIARPLLGAA